MDKTERKMFLAQLDRATDKIERLQKAVSNTASVKLSCGRFYLEVAGVILLIEGDTNRDPNMQESRWSKESLKELAEKINSNVETPLESAA